MATLEMID